MPRPVTFEPGRCERFFEEFALAEWADGRREYSRGWNLPEVLGRRSRAAGDPDRLGGSCGEEGTIRKPASKVRSDDGLKPIVNMLKKPHRIKERDN